MKTDIAPKNRIEDFLGDIDYSKLRTDKIVYFGRLCCSGACTDWSLAQGRVMAVHGFNIYNNSPSFLGKGKNDCLLDYIKISKYFQEYFKIIGKKCDSRELENQYHVSRKHLRSSLAKTLKSFKARNIKSLVVDGVNPSFEDSLSNFKKKMVYANAVEYEVLKFSKKRDLLKTVYPRGIDLN